LTLFFPEQGTCFLLPDAQGKQFSTPATFRNLFNCPIGFVAILGPVEHHEPLFEKEAARLALFNYRAARNFRNIWYYYPEKFDLFRELLEKTWPGMDIDRPEVDRSYSKPRLHMYCPEHRIPRELFWSGFGFQVWCQMLTHLIQSNDVALFLIDEPDIYLHSELQRQLIGLLKNLGPDILIATHSTEIIIEAEANDIIVINKARQHARRMKDTSQLGNVLAALGSNLNPILTQLAKTHRVLFVEGQDFQILAKFARKLGAEGVANRRDFAVVSVDGFSPDRIRTLRTGMEATLGTNIVAAAILDRDYRCDGECDDIYNSCKNFCEFVCIHKVKEVENFLLVPSSIDRAVAKRLAERAKRSGTSAVLCSPIADVIDTYCLSKKGYTLSQLLASRRHFERGKSTSSHESKLSELTLNEFDKRWIDLPSRFGYVSGKDCFSFINVFLQDNYNVTVTPTSIVDAMHIGEVPHEVSDLITMLSEFALTPVPTHAEFQTTHAVQFGIRR
jgi:hypothetical protein